MSEKSALTSNLMGIGIGSALVVAVSRVPLLAAIPGIVWGFASTVGVIAVTGRHIVYTDSIETPS